jgi:hypothetical protein
MSLLLVLIAVQIGYRRRPMCELIQRPLHWQRGRRAPIAQDGGLIYLVFVSADGMQLNVTKLFDLTHVCISPVLAISSTGKPFTVGVQALQSFYALKAGFRRMLVFGSAMLLALSWRELCE